MGILRWALLAAGAATLTLAASAQALSLHLPRTLSVRKNVPVGFSAPALPGGGYYYGVLVLRPYRHYTRKSQPPCSSSSDMQRADYGYPQTDGRVALALTPAKSRTGHWCRGGSSAVYAVPHAPPCESSYPCRSEPYEPPCAGVGPGCVHGVVARPAEWSYPDRLPKPLAAGTTIVARFAVGFQSK